MNWTRYVSPSGQIVKITHANDPVASRILSFRELPEGWHYGVGRGAVALAVDNALAVNSLIRTMGATDVEVFPETEGGILVAGYNGEECVEVLCRADGRLEFVYDIADEVVSENPDILFDDLVKFLRGTAWRSKRSSGYFIRCITAGASTGSQVSHSGIPPITGEFLSSNLPVRSPGVATNAIMFDSITPTWQGSLLFSGELTPGTCRANANWRNNVPPPETIAT
ncbi:MAG: hypothetical protein GDA49_13390 [Rhodospirillales bacterium]|nr:hypothetical protein [Rhodospirillales bacterium]